MMRPQFIENLSLSIFEKVAYMVALCGMIGDQISTRLGLSCPDISEGNPNTAWLMEHNLWFPFDFLISFMIIAFTAIFVRRNNEQGSLVMLSFPMIFGVTRLFTTIFNLILYFSLV